MKDKIIGIMKKLINDKKRLMLILLGCILVIIIIVLIIFAFSKKDELIGVIKNPDGVKIKNEYEKLNDVESEDGKLYPEVILPSNNILRYSNINEILNIFENDKDAVVYFGFSTCLYCRSAIEVLCNVASSTELDVIYYLDVEVEGEGYDKLLKVLGDRFIIKKDGKNKIYAPTVLFIDNGNIVSHNRGTLFSQEDPYQELNKDQVEGLSEIYKYGIRDVMFAKNNN